MPRPGRLTDQRPDLSGRPFRHHLVLTKRGERTSSKEVAPLNSLMVRPPSGGHAQDLLSPHRGDGDRTIMAVGLRTRWSTCIM